MLMCQFPQLFKVLPNESAITLIFAPCTNLIRVHSYFIIQVMKEDVINIMPSTESWGTQLQRLGVLFILL